MHPEQGAEWLHKTIMDKVSESIEKKQINVRKSTHPWLNSRVEQAVKEKAQALPEHLDAASKRCSTIIKEEHTLWVERSKAQLKDLPPSSKEWWKRSRQLALQKEQISSIPALKSTDGEWVVSAQRKADLFADTFERRYVLPAAEENEYSNAFASHPFDLLGDPEPSEEKAFDVLKSLDASSATGPDNLSARILKRCAKVLKLPLVLLARTILTFGHWPSIWEEDWVVPLFKKKSQFDPKNYRGVHLTAQLSKAMERLLGRDWIPHMSTDCRIGRNQFAYRVQRGSRDAIAYLTFTWLNLLRQGRKVAVYLSDVSGAFDRVDSDRLILKLEHKGMGRKLVRVIRSWLQRRRASVVVSGQKSRTMILRNQVFQGIVFGPPLWNQFVADAAVPVRQTGYSEVIYADDLNAFKSFSSTSQNADIRNDMQQTQRNLHTWGRANQVEFDAGKEGFAILSRWPGQAEGVDFRILGILFDNFLSMASAVDELVRDCRWKVRSLFRCQRHFDVKGTVRLFKGRVLPYIEHRTPALYHAADTHLHRVDCIQSTFLEKLGISELEALFLHGLAPLGVRRDIALLGLIHRSVMKIGVSHFEEFFFLSGAAPPPGNWEKHRFQLREYNDDEHGSMLSYAFGHGRGEVQSFVKRSVFGLIKVYNNLPKDVVEGAVDVSHFQHMLQNLIKNRAVGGYNDWKCLLSPRHL